eukprot:UN27297
MKLILVETGIGLIDFCNIIKKQKVLHPAVHKALEIGNDLKPAAAHQILYFLFGEPILTNYDYCRKNLEKCARQQAMVVEQMIPYIKEFGMEFFNKYHLLIRQFLIS